MRDSIGHLLQQIVDTEHGEPFYWLETAAHKTWLLPRRNIRTAMAFYQPTTPKGKIIKWLIPYLSCIPFARHLRFIRCVHLRVRPALENLWKDLWGLNATEISIFCGTPSVHQKITIQISQGSRILGYCKLTDNPQTATLFDLEEHLLKELHEKGITQVPRCLYNGPLSDSIFAFVQSTDRTSRATTCQHFTNYHQNLLRQIHTATTQSRPFAETDFAASLDYLSKCESGIRPSDRDLLRDAIHIVRDLYGNQSVAFSFYHGDFTPWNTFLVEKKVYAFDLEYACRTCPPYMDACHFISETARVALKLDAKEALAFFFRQIKPCQSEVKDPKYLYLCYLLHTLSFYNKLHDGKFDTRDKGYTYWTALIQMIMVQIEGSKTA